MKNHHIKQKSIFKLSIIFFSALMICKPSIAETEKTNYYIGESKMTSPEGTPYGSSISLIKRTISPDKNQITEDVISIDKRSNPREFITVFSIGKNNQFNISDNEKTFSGKGSLSGKEWNWDGWTYQVDMANSKGSLKGDDKFINGELVVSKEYYAPDGKLSVKFSENFKPVSKEFFDILYTNLFPKK